MKKYNPNFKNPRVQARCQMALNWVHQFPVYKPTQLSKKLIDTYLGSSRNDLSKWLRSQVLICTDEHYNRETGKCKTYIHNPDGIRQLEQWINPRNTFTLPPNIETQLETGEIEYKEVNDRLFAPFQFIPKTVRKPAMAKIGYRYNYDIKCAAPTLIKQYAQRLGLIEDTPALDSYIANRASMRTKIAADCNLTEEQVKKIINALLNGARLSCSYESSIWHLLEQDKVKYNLLKENEDIKSLREDFKKCWLVIEQHYPREYLIDKRGNERKKVFGSKRKSEIYRKIELEIIKEIQRYMKKNKIRVALIHDGWSCDTIIDPIELRTLIRNKLGYVVDIDLEIWEYV